jgi:hypothetical protein
MDNIKTIFERVKKGGLDPTAISEYQEAVDELSKSPVNFLLNLEYIIPSGYGLGAFGSFMEKNLIPTCMYNPILELLDECSGKFESRTQAVDNPYPQMTESFMEKYNVASLDFISLSNPDAIDRNKYIPRFYEAQTTGNVTKLFQMFGESALADMINIELESDPNHVQTSETNSFLESALSSSAVNANMASLLHYMLTESPDRLGKYMEILGEERVDSIINTLYEASIFYPVDLLQAREHRVMVESIASMGSSISQGVSPYEYTEDDLHIMETYFSFLQDAMLTNTSLYQEAMEVGETISAIEDCLTMVPGRITEGFFDNFKNQYDQNKKAQAGEKARQERSKSMTDKTITFSFEDEPAVLKDIREKMIPLFQKAFREEAAKLVIPETMDWVDPLTTKEIEEVASGALEYSKKEWLKEASYVSRSGATSGEYRYSLDMTVWTLGHLDQDMNSLLAGPICGNVNRQRNLWPKEVIKIDVGGDGDEGIFSADLDSDTARIVFMEKDHPSVPMSEAPTTSNKKTGKAPDYLRTNHDMGYGEEDDIPKSGHDLYDAEENIERPDWAKDSYKFPDASSSSDDKPSDDPPKAASDSGQSSSSSSNSGHQQTPHNPPVGSTVTNYYNYYRSFNRDSDNFTHSDNHSQRTKNTNIKTIGDPSRVDEAGILSVDPIGDMLLEFGSKPAPKLTDMALDVDRATVKTQQAAKKGVQRVANLGKAIAKPFVRANNWITNMIREWKDKDENALKEKISDPHARSTLWEGIKKAIAVGSFAKAGLLFNPIFLGLAILKKVGRNRKDARIRAEIIGELKTELAILDKKIQTADYNNDMKNSAKMMRIKNELEKKLIRVAGDQTKVSKII